MKARNMSLAKYLSFILCPWLIISFVQCEVTDFLMGGRQFDGYAHHFWVELEVDVLDDEGLPLSEAHNQAVQIIIEYPGDVLEPLAADDDNEPQAGENSLIELADEPVPVRITFSGTRPYGDPPVDFHPVIYVRAETELSGNQELLVRLWYREPETEAPERERQLLKEASITRDVQTEESTENGPDGSNPHESETDPVTRWVDISECVVPY